MNILGRYSLTPAIVAALALCGSLNGRANDQNTSATGQKSSTYQPSAVDRSSSTEKLDRKEVNFIKDAAQGGQIEADMGKLAAEKGQNSEVKQLGQRLQQDHAKANQELMQIAQKNGVNLPAEPTRKENRMVQKLQDKSGADFDKAFTEHALSDHEKDIRKFEKASQDCKDPELKAWIDKNLPALREHLQMARNAGSAVGVSQRALSAADRFLSGEGSQISGTTGVNRRDLGTAPKSQTGKGSSATKPESSSDQTTEKQDK